MDEALLAKSTLFANLSSEQIRKIAERGERREVPEGELVFAEGSRGTEVFVLIEGRVKITVTMNRESEQAPVHTVLPGHVFGEFALVTDLERSANARAVKDSVCFAFSREVFHELAEEESALGYLVLKNLGEILVGRIVKTTRELRASLMF